MHISINKGRKSAILNLTKFNFFREYPSLKPYILFHSNGHVEIDQIEMV